MNQEVENMKTNILLRLNQIGFIRTKSIEKRMDINDSIRDCIDLLDRFITFLEDEDGTNEDFDELKADYTDTIRFINKILIN